MFLLFYHESDYMAIVKSSDLLLYYIFCCPVFTTHSKCLGRSFVSIENCENFTINTGSIVRYWNGVNSNYRSL